MTLTRGRDLESKADDLRAEGKYELAAEYYSIAAFECFGDSIPSVNGETASFGEELLLESVLCNAIAGNETSRQNRASMGVLIAEDIIDRELSEEFQDQYDRSRKGAWYEFIGDFKLAGKLGDHETWYDKAEQQYLQHGDPSVSLAEQEHLNLFTFYRVVMDYSECDDPGPIPTEGTTFSDWIEMKRSNLPSLIESAIKNVADECDDA